MSFLSSTLDGHSVGVFSSYTPSKSRGFVAIEKMEDIEDGYDADDRVSSFSSAIRADRSFQSVRQSFSSSESDYDMDERTLSSSSSVSQILTYSESDYDMDERTSSTPLSYSQILANSSLRLEGANGYVPLNPADFASKKAKVFANLETTDPRMLTGAFYRQVETQHTDSWAIETLDLLATHFGPISIQPLSSGSNSGVFILEQKNSSEKKVLRIFSIYGLASRKQSRSYRLDKHRVGGEWLNMAVDHPNVAANSHILVWDSLTGFSIMNREKARNLIGKFDQLEDGKELYAIGTVGNFVEGAVDLEKLNVRELSEEQVKKILKGLFIGVAAFHDKDICHRDLKPSNVILLPSGEAQLIDFGSAATAFAEEEDLSLQNFFSEEAELVAEAASPARGERQTRRLSQGGDFAYHPAENFSSGVTRSGKKTDSYGLFRIAYHLVTGKDYFGRIKETPLAAARRLMFSQKHEELLKKEKRAEFSQILREDANLAGSKPELIYLLSALGTGDISERILPKAALDKAYFWS